MTFDDFLVHVLPSVEGCPDSVARDHVVKAARTFCAKTLVWNFTANTIASEAGKADYTLQLAKDQELVRVLLAEVDGCQYAIPEGPYGRHLARRSVGNLCVMKGAQDFSLSPAPSLDGAQIVTDVAVKPKLDSNYWPDDFAEHVTDIAAGAISTLCALPRVQWKDVDTAATQGEIFKGRISTVAMKVARGLGSSGQRSRITWK